jgi:hypothetical protein
MGALYNFTRGNVKNQAPGYTTNAYISLITNFLAIADPLATPASDIFKITTDHTFTSPAGFNKCYSLPKQSEASSETVGEAGGLTPIYKHKLFFPGDSPELQAMLDELRNQEVMVLVEDATQPGGTVIQYGTKKLPAYVEKISFQSGNQLEGTKGYVVEFTSATRFFYSGVITVT